MVLLSAVLRDLVDSSPRLWLMKTNPRARGARVGKRPTGANTPANANDINEIYLPRSQLLHRLNFSNPTFYCIFLQEGGCFNMADWG